MAGRISLSAFWVTAILVSVSTVAVIPEAAHLVNMDQPDEFNCTVLEFLDTLSYQDSKGAEE